MLMTGTKISFPNQLAATKPEDWVSVGLNIYKESPHLQQEWLWVLIFAGVSWTPQGSC